MLPKVRMWRSNLHSTHVWNKCSRTRWVNPPNSHVGEPAKKGQRWGYRSPTPWSHMHLMNSVVAIVWVWMLFSKCSIPHFKRDWSQSVPCEAGRVVVVHVVFENAIQENFHNWRASSGASSTDFIWYRTPWYQWIYAVTERYIHKVHSWCTVIIYTCTCNHIIAIWQATVGVASCSCGLVTI